MYANYSVAVNKNFSAETRFKKYWKLAEKSTKYKNAEKLLEKRSKFETNFKDDFFKLNSIFNKKKPIAKMLF